MGDNSRVYNSVWQLRGDAWCRLEEASDRLTKPTTSGELKDEYVTMCRDLDQPVVACSLSSSLFALCSTKSGTKSRSGLPSYRACTSRTTDDTVDSEIVGYRCVRRTTSASMIVCSLNSITPEV